VINFTLSEEQLALKDMTARVAQDRYAPHALDWDESSTFFPKEEKRFLADLGLLGICLPEEYGGAVNRPSAWHAQIVLRCQATE
jgi:alkylation response protein AidB-like acyl-CoA dehydrogenase